MRKIKQLRKKYFGKITSTHFLILGLLLIVVITIVNQLLKPRVLPGTSLTPALELISTEPAAGDHSSILSTYPIRLHFNQSLKPDSVKISSTFSRQIHLSFENGNKTLVLTPQVGWDLTKSQVITIEEAISTEGVFLTKPVVYDFKVVVPTIGPDHYWNEPTF